MLPNQYLGWGIIPMMPSTMPVSAQPGCSREESTSKVLWPKEASSGMYPEFAMPLVSVASMVFAYGDSLLRRSAISL